MISGAAVPCDQKQQQRSLRPLLLASAIKNIDQQINLTRDKLIK